MTAQPNPIEGTYLPVSAEQLAHRFKFAARGGSADPIARYLTSARAYRDYMKIPPTERDPKTVRRARQIEKDETFWTAAALMAFYNAPDRRDAFKRLLVRAFGREVPLNGGGTWDSCLDGEIELFFEVGLSSPRLYREWLQEHLADRTLIPYVRERAAAAGSALEGRTHLDAMLLVPETGFAVHFEAKVTSDIDTKITYDLMRNQIARNIDAMLEKPRQGSKPPLSSRDPDRSLFILLTPRMFEREENRGSRLYGRLLPEYQNDPRALASDLPHRTEITDWSAISKRLGWLTWEDCNEVLPRSCGWLPD